MILGLPVMILLTACKINTKRDNQPQNQMDSQENNVFESNKQVGALYRKIYAQAYKEGNLSSLKVITEIISCLGDAGYDGGSGHVAVRVKLLNEKCREYNQKYVLPIGYEINNLLIADWSEEDYGNVNFYDLFDILYPLKYGKYVPYKSDYTGKEYEIPKGEFETVLQSYSG